MSTYHSKTDEAYVEVDVKNSRISVQLFNVGKESGIVRLLLSDIGFEAGAAGSCDDGTGADHFYSGSQYFSFKGDVVCAAIWLRSFNLAFDIPGETTREISIEQNLFEALAKYKSSSEPINNFAFAGSSWLISNITEFASIYTSHPPGEGRLPVFGIQAAAFGDVGWFDDKGEQSVDNYLDSIPNVYRAMIEHDKLILLIDMSNEGQVLLENWMILLHDGLQSRKIPSDNCILLQQNRAFAEKYIAWAKKFGFSPLRVCTYDYYPRRMVGYLSKDPIPIGIPRHRRKKKFCCFNFTPRPNRTSMVAWLLGKGLEDCGYISFSNFDHFKYPTRTPQICDWFPDIEVVRRGAEILQRRVPLVLDLVPGEKVVPEYDLGPKYVYDDTYISIVTESEVSDGDNIRITEKIIKPLAMFHPIILLGNPGGLNILRELGFKTFGGLFDETYDEILDPSKRVNFIMSELDRVLSMSIDSLHDAYWNLWPTLLFNAMHARRVLNEHFKYQIEPSILNELSRAVK